METEIVRIKIKKYNLLVNLGKNRSKSRHNICVAILNIIGKALIMMMMTSKYVI